MFNKLSFKIGILFFVFFLIIEAFLFFTLYSNLANDRIEEVMENLLGRGNTHREVLERNFQTSTIEHVAIMESASDFAVIITDEAGEVLVYSDPINKEMRHIIDRVKEDKIPKNGKIVEKRWEETEFIATDSPIVIDGKHEGNVFMFADTENVKKIIDQLSDQFLMVSIITISLTIIVIMFLSKFIAIPLIRMKEATEQLSKGDHRVALHTERTDELGELANSITKLSNDLEQMKLARNEFLASVSHELRTPLTYLKGYADIISRDETPKEEMKEYTKIIREEAEHLTHLIKNLFDLAEMDENNFAIKREAISLYEFTRTIAERVKPAFEKSAIQFSFSCEKELIADVDPARLQQVIFNILDNARKHSSEGSKVNLSVRQKEDAIWIIIQDEGEGIPAEDLPYIFDRLYRVEKSRSRDSGGTGLGLSIAKEIIESHEGEIEASSVVGKGTTIRIRLRKGGRENA
ncbi:HAMP domain-containing sensor histidine kinase [Virgibacillus sp. SK37]|uniref:sensor histidine kinase n=1 Tax=Virgibacillus sp. SK37 TaxID=403957 RepID=UPI0004D16FE2|nr:HAMP domain-containing sensor histidine kinase [Virgibacillus sp. SK37]AIF43103.1 sensor histidine kinase [Virgibacillus sp. SK37]